MHYSVFIYIFIYTDFEIYYVTKSNYEATQLIFFIKKFVQIYTLYIHVYITG